MGTTRYTLHVFDGTSHREHEGVEEEAKLCERELVEVAERVHRGVHDSLVEDVLHELSVLLCFGMSIKRVVKTQLISVRLMKEEGKKELGVD